MGDLKAFMLPPVTDETEEVIISDRFKDEKGNVQAFKIRVLSQEINESLRRRSSTVVKKNGVRIGENLDTIAYGRELIVAATVYPNFRAEELCDYYKTKDPLDVPTKMLTAGEYNKLAKAINILNGFSEDPDAAEEEAKNS